MARDKDKKRKFPFKWLIFLLIIVFLLAWFEGFIPGIGSGREMLSRRLNSGSETAVTTKATEDAPVQVEHSITLSKEQIFLDGKSVTFEELARQIQSWPAEVKVKISEENAIKETYDQVIRLLDEQQIKH